MRDRVFLDTNILIYAIESAHATKEKSEVARRIVCEKNAVISTQVLGEFYNATTSTRRQSPLSHAEATAWIHLWKRLEVCELAIRHVDLALETVERFKLSYYDALILSSARASGCSIAVSEDMNSNQVYGSVTVVNPFA